MQQNHNRKPQQQPGTTNPTTGRSGLDANPFSPSPLEKMRAKNEELTGELTKVQEEMGRLKRDAKLAQEGGKSGTAELERQNADLRAQLAQVKQEKEGVERDKIQLFTTITESQKTSAQLQRELDEFRKQNQALAAEVVKLKKENTKLKQPKPEHKVLDEERIANHVVERLRVMSRADGVSFFESSRVGGVDTSRVGGTQVKPLDAKKEKTRTPGGDLSEMAEHWSQARLLLIIAVSRAAELTGNANAIEQILEAAPGNSSLAPFTKFLEGFKLIPVSSKESGARKRLVNMLTMLIFEEMTPKQVYDELAGLAAAPVGQRGSSASTSDPFYANFIAVLNKNTIAWSQKDPRPHLTEDRIKALPKDECTEYLGRTAQIYHIFRDNQPSFLPRKNHGIVLRKEDGVVDFENHFKKQRDFVKKVEKGMTSSTTASTARR